MDFGEDERLQEDHEDGQKTDESEEEDTGYWIMTNKNKNNESVVFIIYPGVCRVSINKSWPFIKKWGLGFLQNTNLQ